MPGVHAELSPSASKRWTTCTRSIQLEKQFPEKVSQYAEEGTTAHELAEVLIKQYLKLIPPVEQLKILERIQFNNAYYNQEMLRYCNDYKDYVIEAYSDAAFKSEGNAHIFIEKHLDISNVHEGIFGTGDIVIVWPGHAHLIDFKYGQGVPVDVEDNHQMKLYACGVLKEFGKKFNIKNIKLTIYQPRIDSIASWETTTEYVLSWAHQVVIPAAKAAMAGQGEFVAGEHCRFCKAEAMCRANADYNLEIAQDEFKDPNLLTPEEISNILLKHTHFTSWIKAVVDYATEQALKGKQKWPGMKIVEGRSVRKYINENAIIRTLSEDLMFDESEFMERKLIGISAMEALLGKKNFKKYIGDNVIKPAGNPTLVPITNKRHELGSAENAHNDFESIE